MNSEAFLDVLALVVVFVSVIALAVSLCYSVPYAFSRIAMYPKPGARRTFARLTLYQIAAPTVVIACFLVSGISILSLEDSPARSAITRVSLLAAICIVSAQAVLTPIGHRAIQELAEEERRQIAEGHEKRHENARSEARKASSREKEHNERHRKEGT